MQINKRIFKKIFLSIALVLSGIVLGMTFSAVHAAWTEPTLAPPQGNIEAPLNASKIGQTKAGGLFLGTANPAIGLMVNSTSSVIFGGAVGIGSINPDDYENAASKHPGITSGGLDIIWGGNTPNYPSTLVLGADTGKNTRNGPNGTQPTAKSFWVSAPLYDMSAGGANSYSVVMGGKNTSNGNIIDIGGGSSFLYTATQISFFTAADTLTKPGTETVTITPGQLQVNGQLKLPTGAFNGALLTSNGSGIASWGTVLGGYQNFLVFDYNTSTYSNGARYAVSPNGNYTWTVPPGVTKIMVEAWGGGGAQGNSGCHGSAAPYASGGGGGGYGRAVFSVTSGNSYNVVVGGGGIINATCATEPHGASSTFGALIEAGGGGGGGINNATPGKGGTSDAPFNISGEPGGEADNQSGVIGQGGAAGNGGSAGLVPGGGGVPIIGRTNGAPGRVVVWY